jgi:hypothetical protein
MNWSILMAGASTSRYRTRICNARTRSGLQAENDANDALDLLEPLRFEREGYFNPAIRRPIDVEHQPPATNSSTVPTDVTGSTGESPRSQAHDLRFILRSRAIELMGQVLFHSRRALKRLMDRHL